mmetsp:Transcript_12175/g.10795  ORF Transcript_12175/g.10795 Transcript_12175/m.10795 type:complete len:221 (+) Transcript_12175:945-1607(+)
MIKVRDLLDQKRIEALESRRSLASSSSQANNLRNTIEFMPDYLKENIIYPGLETDLSIERAYTKDELQMEHLKQQLCKREDFNIFEVYKMYFDTGFKGHINQQDFDQAMKILKVYECDESDITNLDQVFRSSLQTPFNDHLPNFSVKEVYILPEDLKYSSFCSMLLPISKKHADLAINRNSISNDRLEGEKYSTGSIKLLGHTHKKLQDMLREVFEQIII